MTPEAIASFVSAGAVSIAAGVTAWMAMETRRAARAATEALELERRPVLGARDVRLEHEVDWVDVEGPGGGQRLGIVGIRVGVELFNAGRVPVRYAMKKMSAVLTNRTMTRQGDYRSRTGLVLPGGSITFWQPLTAVSPALKDFPAVGHVSCEFEYADDRGGGVVAYKDAFEFTIMRTGSGGFASTWVHVDSGGAPATGQLQSGE